MNLLDFTNVLLELVTLAPMAAMQRHGVGVQSVRGH
jgi:hypothetical protein